MSSNNDVRSFLLCDLLSHYFATVRARGSRCYAAVGCNSGNWIMRTDGHSQPIRYSSLPLEPKKHMISKSTKPVLSCINCLTSYSLQIPRCLRNPKVCFRFNRTPSLGPSWITWMQVTPSAYFLRFILTQFIHTPACPRVDCAVMFPDQNFVPVLVYTMCTTRLTQLFIIRTVFCKIFSGDQPRHLSVKHQRQGRPWWWIQR